MADRSVKYPCGIIKDVLVKMDKFNSPADFIMVDMDKDADIPIILGKPFFSNEKNID